MPYCLPLYAEQFMNSNSIHLNLTFLQFILYTIYMPILYLVPRLAVVTHNRLENDVLDVLVLPIERISHLRERKINKK